MRGRLEMGGEEKRYDRHFLKQSLKKALVMSLLTLGRYAPGRSALLLFFIMLD